jgi:photosystem II stability/assembly factor-like uncharacterized protein
MRRMFLSVCLASLAVSTAYAVEQWQPVGLGGMGGMFSMAVSPLNAKLMIVNCDMSAAYLTRDGGHNWQMIHLQMLHGNTKCSPVFHPTIADRVYAANGGNSELRRSDDAGVTWRPLLNGKPDWHDVVTFLYVAREYADSLLVCAGDDTYVTLDGGATWRACQGVSGKVVGAMTKHPGDASEASKYNFIATEQGIFRSGDLQKGYTPCKTGLPQGTITGFSGGSNGGNIRLYATVECSLVQDKLAGGVFVSEDAGNTWQSCMQGGLNVQTQRNDKFAKGDLPQYKFILTTDKDPQRVYVYCAGTSFWPPNHSTVYRSDDGGKTWRETLFLDPRFAQKKLYNVADDYTSQRWGQREQGPPRSMVIGGGDPDVLAMCTSAWCLRTDDGGRSWWPCHTGPSVKGDGDRPAWLCNGLVVTTTWNYYIDPHQSNRHYICYTDIGFARSIDSGKSWIWEAQSLPWHNTTYALAFDPDVPGRIWAAGANSHDIPNNNPISGHHRIHMDGGVAVSDDFGASWKKLDLPDAPGLSVVVDPTSPKEARVLYASLFEKGVYKSTDGGKTWAKASQGLGSPKNMRCCKCDRDADGNLFVLITGKKGDGGYTLDGVGLYRSTDGAASWSKISSPLKLHWFKDFTVKPGDPKTILLSAANIHGKTDEAGLYRTTDGGQTWKKLVQKGPEHFGAFYHPQHPGWIYITLTEGAKEAGLYLSKDDGATWQPFSTLPFRNIQRIVFDPAHPKEMILTTFGSAIIRGPDEP